MTGAVAVMVVASTTVTPVAGTPENVTMAPGANPVPVMVTAAPPATGPVGGVTEVTTGCGSAGCVVPMKTPRSVAAAQKVGDAHETPCTTTFDADDGAMVDADQDVPS